ncbi:hypothetical protein H5410_029588 [Solanum commersonii]|uniref:Uncharacterized protein n=1 Tax=Solanum commersonii TaxID=4109 RepID=A0A9J5YDD6_SOLCO|nr:hypothetical protein H5410_029588 [Solanum commersonii]
MPQTPDYLTLESLDAGFGVHANKLEMLSLAFAGDRDCPFGNETLLANAAKLETIFEAQKLSGLNVEVIDERGRPDTRPESSPVEKLYIYRTVSGRRFDTPGFVWIIDEDAALTPYSNGSGFFLGRLQPCVVAVLVMVAVKIMCHRFDPLLSDFAAINYK